MGDVMAISGAEATSSLVSKVLDLLVARQATVAHNLANQNVDGFKPMTLDFDAALRGQSNVLLDRSSPASVVQAVNTIEASATESDGPVRIEDQMLELSETVLRYQSLVDARNRLGGILRAVVSGGAR